MRVKYDTLIANHTWYLIDYHKLQHSLSAEWLFKQKKNINVNIKKYKAWWVERNFQKNKGFIILRCIILLLYQQLTMFFLRSLLTSIHILINVITSPLLSMFSFGKKVISTSQNYFIRAFQTKLLYCSRPFTVWINLLDCGLIYLLVR